MTYLAVHGMKVIGVELVDIAALRAGGDIPEYYGCQTVEAAPEGTMNY